MFWGLIMEPNKRYTQTIEKSFHLSMASLDLSHTGDEAVQVMLCYENSNYLLCNLNKKTYCQVPLDLNFQQGTKIAFVCNGKSIVHLTGYLVEDINDYDDLEDEDEDEEDLDVEDLEKNIVKELQKNKQGKRRALEATSPVEKTSKRLKMELEGDDDDDSDEDDSDEDLEDENNTTVENEEDSDEDEEDSDEDGEDDDSAEEEEEVPKPVVKSKKQLQQEQQKNKKQEKQKMVNGKGESPQEKKKQNKKQKEEVVPEQKKKADQKQQNVQIQVAKKTLEGGIQIEDLKVGNGAPAKPGKFVSVYYTGKLKNGKKFDSTQQGEGFKFRLGKGEVIKGWDIGISGMKVGGKRRITIPPHLAYGNKGSPPQIPGNSTLIFEVDLKNTN